MNELSLFTGIGGGLLGTKLLGFRAIGYVEWEPYCQAVLAQRIRDGYLEEAPIFGDIREFVVSGAARKYRGFADVVTAGFPCQPFSHAGRQLAESDPRNMWPATADVLRAVRPAFALLENVPGLFVTGYCERIFGDLAALGFDAQWGVFSAAGSGAPHLRERLFILAHAPQQLGDGRGDFAGIRSGGATVPEPRNHRRTADVADASSHGEGGRQCPASHLSLTKAVNGWNKDGSRWPTPIARDSRTLRGGQRMKNSHGTDPLIQVVGGSETQPKSALNPEWVEWLMGYPIGWTDLKPLATDRFQQWSRAHGLNSCAGPEDRA